MCVCVCVPCAFACVSRWVGGWVRVAQDCGPGEERKEGKRERREEEEEEEAPEEEEKRGRESSGTASCTYKTNTQWHRLPPFGHICESEVADSRGHTDRRKATSFGRRNESHPVTVEQLWKTAFA